MSTTTYSATAHARRSIPPAARANEAAVVSFCCALVLPLAAARAFLAARAGISTDAMEVTLGFLLSLCCAPAAIVAVVTGHQALLRARRLPAAGAYWRLAWCGLLGGYLCMAIIFGARIAPMLPATARASAPAITSSHALAVDHNPLHPAGSRQ